MFIYNKLGRFILRVSIEVLCSSYGLDYGWSTISEFKAFTSYYYQNSNKCEHDSEDVLR